MLLMEKQMDLMEKQMDLMYKLKDQIPKLMDLVLRYLESKMTWNSLRVPLLKFFKNIISDKFQNFEVIAQVFMTRFH
ncbi:UNKNOWN [Stylonychia lemnae]|uniref:Uncharacterized protein n=1 Tax=Stylonychia lemnae TaxID=5949 RepID=A0A078BDG6_STYLE|nr:UNKNOWN [Stylonychia lemnae]|eukprot:CDW91242.1 UNKNOWN [Stylonychia lemnae]